MITLAHAGAVPLLCGQLEGGLEEVHEQPHRRIELRQGCGGFKPLQPAIADDAAHHGTVLLLDKSLIILAVGAGKGRRHRPRT